MKIVGLEKATWNFFVRFYVYTFCFSFLPPLLEEVIEENWEFLFFFLVQ